MNARDLAQVPLEDLDYEKRVLDVARRALDDVHACREAAFNVRWVEGMPLLVIAFTVAGARHLPAVGVGLVSVRRGTMLEPMPNGVRLEGDRLRDHILRSVFLYLEKHGIRVTLIQEPSHADV